MSNQTQQKQVSKLNQKSPKEQLDAMIRYREFRKQRVEPETIEHPDEFFVEQIVNKNLINDYLEDPFYDIPVHSERANKRLI